MASNDAVDFEIDPIPDKHLLESSRTRRWDWTGFFGELIDNALDAGAKTITFTLHGKGNQATKITVQDDGAGAADLTVVFGLGNHAAHGMKKGLGTYGVGFKDCALWLWGAVKVSSRIHGERYVAAVDWGTYMKAKSWKICGTKHSEDPGASSGMLIEFTKIQADRHYPQQLKSVLETLAFIYQRPIEEGKVIKVISPKKETTVLPYIHPPNCLETMEGDVVVNGKSARIKAGIIPSGTKNRWCGLSYIWRYRVIIDRTGLGCPGINTKRIHGTVLLSDGWQLTKNKNDIAYYKVELGAKVAEFLQPLLNKIAEESRDLDVNDLEKKVQQGLQQLATQAPQRDEGIEKERRDQGASHGTATPRHTERQRKPKKVQPGNSLGGTMDLATIGFQFDDAMEEDEGIGRVDIPGNKIFLAENHPYIQSILRLKDEVYQTMLLQQCAVTLLVNQQTQPQAGEQLFFKGWAAGESKQFECWLGKALNDIAMANLSTKQWDEAMDQHGVTLLPES